MLDLCLTVCMNIYVCQGIHWKCFKKTNRVVINPFYGIYKTLNDKIRIKDILPHWPKYGSRRGKVYEPKSTNQPAHPHSIISAFASRSLARL